MTLIGGAAVAWPLAARAQQPAKMPRVGLVSAQSRSAPNNAAFEKRLGELGYQDGKDFIFDFVQVASLEGWETAFQGLGARKVDIMVAAGPEIAVKTALATSDTIPIVMIAIDYDPFAHGCHQPRAAQRQYHRHISSADRANGEATAAREGCVPGHAGRDGVLGSDIGRPMGGSERRQR